VRILLRRNRLRVFTRTVSICNGKDDKQDKEKQQQYVYDTCTNELVNFKPGEHKRKMIFFSSDKGGSEENIRELPTGVKPMTF